jgi:chromosomal replication initiator protein
VDSDVFTISFARSTVQNAATLSASPQAEFVAGPENAIVKVAVDAVLNRRAQYSPVVFWGPSGTGKSHLAHGIAAADPRAVFTSGADFARELATAIDRSEEARFRQRYRSAELLVLDGLTQLAGRRAALDELRQVLDDAELREALVVVTSCVPPEEIKGFPPALADRLKGGLTVALAPPGAAAKQAILERIANGRGLDISLAAIQLLAKTSNLTVGECRAALMQLEVNARATASDENAIEPIQIGLAEVRKHLAKFYGVKSMALAGPSRRRQVVLARAVAMYLCRSAGNISLEALGRHFGGRDHTTALYSCRSIERRLKHDYELRGAIESLRQSLNER